MDAGTNAVPMGMHAGGTVHQEHDAGKTFGHQAYPVKAGLCFWALNGDPFTAVPAANLSGGFIDAVFCVRFAYGG